MLETVAEREDEGEGKGEDVGPDGSVVGVVDGAFEKSKVDSVVLAASPGSDGTGTDVGVIKMEVEDAVEVLDIFDAAAATTTPPMLFGSGTVPVT